MSSSASSPPQLENVIAGRFEVEAVLGRGGMGVVYSVVDPSGRRMALKRLLSSARGTETTLFEREYRTLSGLRHPRIVEVYEYGVDPAGAYYTMELLQGTDLSKASPMPWPEVCGCLRDLASILGVLHARRLVHRDLSPKNLWRTPSGRLKLLDFGALAPFGQAHEVVGTAPFVPPEAIDPGVLDQRTDLYALGALGYWLLTGTHAFRGKTLGELPRLWSTDPSHPSGVTSLLASDLPAVPEALDHLILSLLRRDPDERPRSTVDVIDTLNAVADLEPEAQDVVVQGYLDSKAFVGRVGERERFVSALARAHKGQPQALFVTGAEGVGRSRFLEELATAGHIGGAVVLRVDAVTSDGRYAVASALGSALLRATPELARRTAERHEPVLGHVSPALRAALGSVLLAQDLVGSRDERARKQAALTSWFLAASRERTLAILVDEVVLADDDSRALLAALAHAGAGHRLLVVVTSSLELDAGDMPAVRSLRKAADILELPPLTAEETHELVRSVFGEVHYLDRLAATLHRVSEGNPRHCMVLAQHLVDSGIARYADGSWSLPAEVAEADLPRTLRAGLLIAVERLSAPARRLVSRLSVPDAGPFSRAMCVAVDEAGEPSSARSLSELLTHGVVRESGSGYRLAHPGLRQALYDQLPEEDRVHCHAILGAELAKAAGEDPVLQLRAALHFLRAGELSRGHAVLCQASNFYSIGVHESMREAAPMLQEGVDILLDAGRRDRDLLEPLSALTIAGYFVERRYADLYGDRAMDALESALYLRRARSLFPFLGTVLALCVTFALSFFALRRVAHAPSPVRVMKCLAGVTLALTGVAATCMTPERGLRYAEVLAPLARLGPRYGVTWLYESCKTLALAAQDRPAVTVEKAEVVSACLRSGKKLYGMPDSASVHILAAMRYVYGIQMGFVDDERVLSAAEELDAFGPLYEMNANQLRTLYYASRGDFDRAAEYRRIVGVQAVQIGSAWRVEHWMPTITMPAFWAHDAVALKRSVDQLARMAVDTPSSRYHERSARAAYCLLRGKPQDAVELLVDLDREPLSLIGWGRTRSFLACGYNMMGEHEKARQVCEAALSAIEAPNRAFVGLFINLQVELSVAEAGLGMLAPAGERLGQLIAHHEPNEGPLLMGYLERAYARVCLLVQDYEGCARHLDATEHWVRTARCPSLLALLGEMRRELRLCQHPASSEVTSTLRSMDSHVVTHVQVLLHRAAARLNPRGEDALAILLDLTGAQSGFFVLADPGRPSVATGAPPSAELLGWARERLRAALEDDEATTEVSTDDQLVDTNVMVVDGVEYRSGLMWAMRRGAEVPVAVLVLGFTQSSQTLPTHDVLRVIANHLVETQERTLHSSGT